MFVHDIKALVTEDGVYARSYGPLIWDRYLTVFSKIIVCVRSRKVTPYLVNGIDKLNGDKVFLDSRIGMFKGPEVFFSKRIKRILKDNIENTDGVIVRLDSFLGLLAINECNKQHKPYICEVVGCAWDSFWNHGLAGKIIAPFMYYFMKRAVKKSPFTIYVTKRFLQQRYPTNGLTANISNVSLPPSDNEILEERLKKIDSTNQNSEIHLMTTANVGVRYKGFQYVIKALGLLKRKFGISSYYYHIVGEGDQSYLREIAKKENVEDNILFHGALPHDEVFKLIKKIDIYVQPSLQEGLPRALIEAMSYGVPSIGTNIAGIPELLDIRFIYPIGKNMIKEIANKLLSLDKETMKFAAINNFENAKEYDSKILNERRFLFLKKYVNTIINSNRIQNEH